MKKTTKASASSSSDSDSEDEKPAKPTPQVSKPSPTKAANDDSDSSDSESDSDSDSTSENEEPKASQVKASKPSKASKSDSSSDSESEDSEDEKAKEKAKSTPSKSSSKAVPKQTSDSSESSDSDSDSESSSSVSPAKTTKVAPKTPLTKPSTPKKKAEESSSSEESDSDDSDSSSDSDVEMEDQTAPTSAKGVQQNLIENFIMFSFCNAGKRKAEDAPAPATKKVRVENDTAPTANGTEETKTIFVGRLSWNVDNDWLASEFAECGEVVSARVQMDRTSGKSRGFAYVTFSSSEAVEAALKLNGKEIDGRPVNIDKSIEKDRSVVREKRANAFGDSASEPSSVIFVGNLSFDATEDTLWEKFSEFGDIKSIRMPTDRETGRVKGFAYVEFADIEKAKEAHKGLSGAEIAGRSVRLDFSRPRDNNGGGRGGFGGGGFGGGRGGRGGFGGDRGGRGGGRVGPIPL